jgi:prepilin-type N-terminal cleavage/methylation domain-containing protein
MEIEVHGPASSKKTSMKTHTNGRLEKGFTLVEIMLVVATIALLAVIAVPSYIRARKRTQAVRVLDGVRALENAITLYTIENNRLGSQAISNSDIPSFLPYIKTNSPLYTTLPNDLFGNPFTLTTLDGTPKVSATTYTALSDVAPASFWSPYYP